jgi:predicted lipoprotein with Yx(FWY)xxD motif
MRTLLYMALVALCSGPAQAQTPVQVSAQQHPVGGYLKHPKAAALIRLEVKWEDASGYPLYVLDRECNAQCARLFPPLTPIQGDKPPSADWTIRTREENGDMQWVYKGRPVYVYSGDYVDRPEKKLPDGSTKPASKAQPPKADLIVPWVHIARQ